MRLSTVCALKSFKTNQFSSYFYSQKNTVIKKGLGDFHLFFHLEQHLGGKDFDNDEEVKVAV